MDRDPVRDAPAVLANGADQLTTTPGCSPMERVPGASGVFVRWDASSSLISGRLHFTAEPDLDGAFFEPGLTFGIEQGSPAEAHPHPPCGFE